MNVHYRNEPAARSRCTRRAAYKGAKEQTRAAEDFGQAHDHSDGLILRLRVLIALSIDYDPGSGGGPLSACRYRPERVPPQD